MSSVPTDKAVEAAARAIYAEVPNQTQFRRPNTAGGYDRGFDNDLWEDAPDRHEVCRRQARAALIAASTASTEAGEPVAYYPHVIHYDGEGSGYHEFIDADIPIIADHAETRHVEILRSLYADRPIVGFRVYDALPPDQAMAERVERLEAEVGHWKSNHDQMVQRNSVLRERPDLPVDRLPAIARYEAKVERLAEALREARGDLLGSGFVGPSPDGIGDPEINRIDAALGVLP